MSLEELRTECRARDMALANESGMTEEQAHDFYVEMLEGEDRARARGDDMVERVPTKRTARVPFTEEEIALMGQELAQLYDQLDDAEADLAVVKKDFKARIEGLQGAIKAKSRAINQGYEMRAVECTTIYDYRKGVATTVRNDTGEVLDTRTLTAEERQASLPLSEGEDEPQETQDKAA